MRTVRFKKTESPHERAERELTKELDINSSLPGFKPPRFLWPWQDDYHWKLKLMENNPHGDVPQLNPHQWEESAAKFDLRSCMLANPLKDYDGASFSEEKCGPPSRGSSQSQPLL